MAGDANADGKVDVGDLGILAANYGLAAGATWEKGDFNKDGKVDVGDLGILAANYGIGIGTNPAIGNFGLSDDKEARGQAGPAPVSTPECGFFGPGCDRPDCGWS